MNNKPFSKIEVNHSDNIVINIKHAEHADMEQLLPGYVQEPYVNDYNSCELCWNCCYPFTNQSMSMPLKYLDGVFYIYGHFCSYNCGARYIFDNFNDKNKWNLYSLLNLYYNISNNSVGEHINPSPNRLSLLKFGGSMDIDEYRSTCSLYNLHLPPIIPIDHSISQITDTSSIKETKESYKLYRKKELNTKNNI